MNLNKVVNFILFQAIWLASVLGAAKGNMISCWILFITLIYWQLFCPKNRNSNDKYFLAVLLPLGLVIDSLWAYFGLIEFREPIPYSYAAPYWIGILWVTFALSLNHSMKWLFDKPKLALLFGAMGGPLSYLAAQRLEAIIIHDTYLTLVLLSVSWLTVMFIILLIDRKLRRSDSYTQAETTNA